MIVKYIGETDCSLTNGREYEVLSVDEECYLIKDDSGLEYLFFPDEFTIVKSD